LGFAFVFVRVDGEVDGGHEAAGCAWERRENVFATRVDHLEVLDCDGIMTGRRGDHESLRGAQEERKDEGTHCRWLMLSGWERMD